MGLNFFWPVYFIKRLQWWMLKWSLTFCFKVFQLLTVMILSFSDRQVWASSVHFYHSSCSFWLHCHNWAASWQNQQTDLCTSEDLDQTGHPSSLIRVFAVRMEKPWALSYPLSTQQRRWSAWADAQADLSLCWAHRSFYWFCRAAAHIH